MSRSSPPRQWHTIPSFDHQPPPDFYNRPETQLRGRTPPRSYSPNHTNSPHGDHMQRRPLSPRGDNERGLSPRGEQQGGRRPISPIRPPSPSLEHPPAPGRERPMSPRRERYSPRRERPPSPGMERPRSPYGWRPRSPPKPYYDYRRRSRSPPPHWIRRSPPRYGPPHSGRSPPRGPWPPGPPPPDWDRYHRPYPDRRSPPRYGPPPPHWDRRWGPGPAPVHSGGPPPPDERYRHEQQKSSSKSSPPKSAESKQESRGEESLLPKDDKEEEIDSFEIGAYDPDVGIGHKYVIPVSGFFCKVCHKFYNSESSAKLTHCKTKTHYDKFAKWLSEKKVAALVKKRSLKDDSKSSDEPPAKQIKVDETPEKIDDAETSKYDPSEPTGAEEETPKKQEQAAEPAPIPKEETTQNGSTDIASTTDEAESESDALITNETKKDTDIDYVEATLFNLRKLKVNQLKANLENRGMKSTGLKPLLLKRLEKVLAEEAALATAETNTEEEEAKKEQLGVGDKSGDEKEYVIKMMESDVEPANKKSQWITERELERELEQVEGVKRIVEIKSERNRVFNGRRTNVEWSIKLLYSGTFPEGGLQFTLSSHQQLPFVAMALEEEQ